MSTAGSALSAAPTCHRLRSPGDNVGHRVSENESRRSSPWIRRATPSVACANAAISGVIASTVCGHARITPRGGSRLTCPAVGSSSPAINRSNVVLPAPLGPTTPVHPVASVSVTSLRVETESVYEKERPESRTNMIAAPQKCSRAEKIARAVVRRHERWSSYFRTPSISPVLDVVENIRAPGANQPISGCLKVCGCSATGAVEDSKGRRSRLVRPA